MLGLIGLDTTSNTAKRPLKILELGCSNGQDAIRFLNDSDQWQVWGVDILHNDIKQDNVTFIQADAASLPFEDDFFDVVISIGLLEHIEPMENLSRVITEAGRVGRSYVHVVPSVSTPLEPHTVSPFWPRRYHANMVEKHCGNTILHLNFFTDHTWSKFAGFSDSDIQRFWYITPLIRNIAIYHKA